jgi:hypothetical protein
MTALVTSSATNRISTASGAPSPERPGNGVGPPGGRATAGRSGGGAAKSGGETAGESVRLA